MSNLSRLQEHLRKREWVHLDREASRLRMMEPLTLREKAIVYRAHGRAKAGLNEPYAAIHLLDQALSFALRSKHWDCLGYARSDIGALYTTIGDINAGVNQLQAYLLDKHRYSDALEQYGKVRFNLGLAYKYQRRYPEAIHEYTDAIDWCTLRGHTQVKAMAHQNLAWLYCTLGQLEDARIQLEVADTYREVLSPSFDAEQICDWAFYHWLTGNIGDAIGCVQEILLAQRAGVDAHHRGQAAVIGGQVAVMLGRERVARQCLTVATDAALDTNDPPLANECAALRAAIQEKWGNHGAAQ